MNDSGTPIPSTPNTSASEDSIIVFLARLGLTDATGTAPSPTAGILWTRLPPAGSSPAPASAPDGMATSWAPEGSVNPIPTLLRRLAIAGSLLSTTSVSQALPSRILSLACGGARVVGLILPRDGGGTPTMLSELEACARTWRLETHRASSGDPWFTSDLIGTQPSSSVFGLVFVHENAGIAVPTHFGAEGDVILLLDAPLIPVAAVGTPDPVADAPTIDPASQHPVEAARLLVTSVLGLVSTGAIRSARVCGMAGLGVDLTEACFGPPDPAGVATSIGARMDLAGGAPGGTPADAMLFRGDTLRILATTGPLEATKTLERARLLGLSAQRIGVVGGDQLAFHTDAGEFAVSLADLRSALPRCVVTS